MVFAVNPPKTGKTFSKFKALAMRAISPLKKTSIMPKIAPNTTDTSTTVSSTAPAPSPTPVVHDVTVGGNLTMTFNPSNITAQPNDIVQFSECPDLSPDIESDVRL